MCSCECMFVCMPTPNYIILQVRLGTERGGWRCGGGGGGGEVRASH